MKSTGAGILIVALVVASSVIDCSRDTTVGVQQNVDNAAQPLGDMRPGTLIKAEPFTDVDRSVGDQGGTSLRITYRSTSGVTGVPTVVTGTAFVPPGQPPHGGWPVLAFAHGTTGIQRECAPSLTPDLLKSISLVSVYLKLGFAVAVPDYEGLGGPGAHPYLDAKTAGLNLIDSVRALRAASSDVSDRWGALGGSQGGAVTWAANEQATTYAPELRLVGAVSLAPLADVTGFVEKAVNNALTVDQVPVYIWTLMGIERTHPNFDIDSFRHGSAIKNWDALAQCALPRQGERSAALYALQPGDLVPSGPAAVHELTEILQKMALPQQRAAAPMLVMYGGKDSYVDAEWTRLAIERACAMGTRIAAVYQPDRGHEDLDPGEYAGWLNARFEGLPAPSTCV